MVPSISTFALQKPQSHVGPPAHINIHLTKSSVMVLQRASHPEQLLAQVCPTRAKREVPYTMYDDLTNLADRRTSCGQSFRKKVTHSLYTMVRVVHNVFVMVRSFLQQTSLYFRSKVSLRVSRRVRPAKMVSFRTFHSASIIFFRSWYDRLSLKRSL
jgi:hypothetical protein